MVRWLCAAVVAFVLSGFAFLLITGEYVNDGPVVATVAQNRGLHVGDVFLLLGWLAALAALVVLTTAAGRRSAP